VVPKRVRPIPERIEAHGAGDARERLVEIHGAAARVIAALGPKERAKAASQQRLLRREIDDTPG
jgi:hypothetical protein